MNIKILRGRLGLSQAGLAKFLGIKIDTLQNWEQGRRGMPPIYEAYLNHTLHAKRRTYPFCPKCGEIGRENYCFNGPGYKTLERELPTDGEVCAICGAGATSKFQVLLWEPCPHCRRITPHQHE